MPVLRRSLVAGATRWGTVLALLASVVAAQEHSYTPADIENGSRLYQSSCAGCHGTTGDSVPGIDLGRGPFRHATSDTEVAAIIRSGARVSSASRTVTRGSCNPSVNLGPSRLRPGAPALFGIPLGD